MPTYAELNDLKQICFKMQKMVLDVALLKTEHYKVRIKSKVE